MTTPPPYLTEEEIAELTKPLTQGAARIRKLRAYGLTVEPKPNGQPLVWRTDLEAVRRREEAAANDIRTQRLDWTPFRNRVRYGRGGEKAQRRQSTGA